MRNHIEITVADHEAYVAAVAERDTLRKRVAELESAPLRIVLDQGPPTEPGWYVAEQEPDGRRQLVWFGHPHPRLRELFLRFSRRIDIVVPESEVPE